MCSINEYGIRTFIARDEISHNKELYCIWGLIGLSFIIFYIAYINLKRSKSKKYLVVLFPLLGVIFVLIALDYSLNNTGILGYALSLVALIFPIIDSCVVNYGKNKKQGA